MFEKVKQIIAVFIAIVTGIRELATAVETDGHGDAKKAFVMGAFDVLVTLDEGLFGGFVSDKLTAAADKVLELWVQFDKIAGIFRKDTGEGDLLKNS